MRWLTVFLVLALGTAQAQQGWSVQQFTAESGLPQNTVRSLAVDSSGYLWVSTEGGLVRYDGRHMRVFSTRNDTDLLEDRMGHLFKDAAGTLLVDDVAGNLYRISVGDLERVVGDRLRLGYERLISGGIPSLAVFRQLMRLNASQALPRWSRWDMRVLPFSANEWAIFSADSLYIHTGERPSVNHAARSILFGAFMVNGDLFYLGEDRVFRRLDRSSGALVDLEVHGIDPAAIYRMHWNTASNDVFAVSTSGIWRLASTTAGSLTFEAIVVDLPKNTQLNAVLLSDNGRTLFVGTSTQGLFRYSRQRFSGMVPLKDDPGQRDNAFYAQALLDSGRVLTTNGWVCGPEGFDAKPFPNVPFDPQLLHCDRAGRVWSVRAHAMRIHDAVTGAFIRQVHSPVGRLSALLEEADTTWWAGSDGLAAWVGDSAQLVFGHVATNYRENPFALVRGPDGHLWWATGKGVYRVVGRRLVPVPGLEKTYARTLCAWRGRMLVGTYGEGPLVVDRGKVVHLPLDDRGALSHVHAFIPDDEGHLWMPTNHGLFKVRMNALENFLTDPKGILAYRSFGRDEGLRTLEFNGGCSPPYLRLPNGEISLPTFDGLLRFQPSAIIDPLEYFRPSVDEVFLNEASVGSMGGEVLRLQRNDRLVVEYTLPFWGNPTDLQVYYRVFGLSRQWLPVDKGADRITIERMPPGKYTLQVMRAGDPTSVRNLLPVVVVSRWYERRWAISSFVVLLVAAVWLLLRLRTGQLLRARQRLEAVVSERTEALQHSNTELTRALGVKDRLISILSHDIVSPLRFISRVATRTLRSARSEQPEVLRHTLAEISTSSEKLYANASNILEWIRNQGGAIAVVPIEVALRALTEEVLAQFQQHASTVRFINAVPEADHLVVDPRLLSIVLQNLVANAAGHAGGSVVIEGERSPSGYRLTVKDNGPGMSDAARQRIRDQRTGHADDRSATDRPGLGYMIIHDVLDLLEGDYTIEVPEAGGTWVHVHLPEKGAGVTKP